MYAIVVISLLFIVITVVWLFLPPKYCIEMPKNTLTTGITIDAEQSEIIRSKPVAFCSECSKGIRQFYIVKEHITIQCVNSSCACDRERKCAKSKLPRVHLIVKCPKNKDCFAHSNVFNFDVDSVSCRGCGELVFNQCIGPVLPVFERKRFEI